MYIIFRLKLQSLLKYNCYTILNLKQVDQFGNGTNKLNNMT